MKTTLPAMLVPAAVLLGIAACTVPLRDYPVDQIAQVGQLDELMDVQDTVTSSRFSLASDRRGQELSADEFVEFEDMATRLAACAQHLPDFSKGPGFDDYANTLLGQARDLGTYAAARDSAHVIETTLAIKQTCWDCHWDYRLF